jgi:hypothetical protein
MATLGTAALIIITVHRIHAFQPPPVKNPNGVILADIPNTVQMNKPFTLDVWFEPSNRFSGRDATIFMEQTDAIAYEPRVFTLRPRERKTVKAVIINSRSGLAQVWASSAQLQNLSVTINVQFAARVKANFKKQFEAGSVQPLSFDFVDALERPIPLDAPVKVIIQASSAKLRQAGSEKQWTTLLELPLEQGASSTALLELKTDPFQLGGGVLLIESRTNGHLVLRNDRFDFDVLPHPALPIFMMCLGGLLNATYRLMKQKSLMRDSRKMAVTLGSGVLAGLFSFILMNWQVLGIKVDATSLRAFLLIGFLVAHLGLDAVLKKVSVAEQK